MACALTITEQLGITTGKKKREKPNLFFLVVSVVGDSDSYSCVYACGLNCLVHIIRLEDWNYALFTSSEIKKPSNPEKLLLKQSSSEINMFIHKCLIRKS